MNIFNELKEGDEVFDTCFHRSGFGIIVKKLKTKVHIQFSNKLEIYDKPHCQFLSKDLIFIMDDKRHLVCIPYSIENLHKAAQKLGIKKCWYHSGEKPHYDIPKRRISEIKSQCKVWSSKDIVNLIYGK